MKLIVAICILVTIISCNDVKDRAGNENDSYANTKASLEKTEQKNPTRFLSASGDNKRNIIGQTVVKGTVHNHAKIVSYKDVDIKLSFYSKTGALLEQDHEMLYENIAPGESKNFKTKFFTPKGTDSVAMDVVGAKY